MQKNAKTRLSLLHELLEGILHVSTMLPFDRTSYLDPFDITEKVYRISCLKLIQLLK